MQIIEENSIKLEDKLIDIIDSEYEDVFRPKILVIGVGGGGVNAVDSMVDSDLEGVDFLVANTDYQSLKTSKVKRKILLGREKTRGVGAGADPEVGKAAAEESLEEIERYLKDVSMVFITAGMGGGTGTGAAPVIAKKAREMDILVAAIVTTPFENEGIPKMEIAEKGIEELKKSTDTLIIVPNQNLFRLENGIKFEKSLKMVNEVLKSGVKGITDLITKRGFVNLDFSDVRTVMKKTGKAMMGTGEASGENKAIRAVEEAISNPLLDNTSIRGAKYAIVNVTGSTDLSLDEFNSITKRVREEIGNKNEEIIFGSNFDDSLQDTIRVSIFATGIEEDEEKKDEVSSWRNEDSNWWNSDDDKKEREFVYKEDKKSNYQQQSSSYEEKNIINKKTPQTRQRIGDYDSVPQYVDDGPLFDMGQAAEYNEFDNKSSKRNTSFISTGFQDDNDFSPVKAEKKTKQEKKSGFFRGFFGSKENSSVNVEGIDDDEDDYSNLNIKLYETPTYLRNKDKRE